jgi:hypothetical protein
LAATALRRDWTPKHKREARAALLAALAVQTDDWTARWLMDLLAKLDPAVGDLEAWREWAAPPTVELLAVVRYNSPLEDWLTGLAWLPAPND